MQVPSSKPKIKLMTILVSILVNMALETKEKTLRPLNSYMAFRAYYSKIFRPLQQKDISGFLTFLWQTDPSESMWILLATTYTILRESIGKSLAPLDKFLAINGPYVGVIRPENYLHTLGFEVHMIHGSFAIRRSPEIDWRVLRPPILISTISVWDILRNSVEHGYCSIQSIDFGKLSKMVMAIAATGDTNDASLTVQTNCGRLENTLDNDTQIFAAIPLRDLGTSNSNSMTSHSALPVIGHNTQQNNGEVPPFDLQRSAVSAVPHEILETAILPPTPINSAFELASTNFHLDGEFPFNEDFTEGGEPLIFDPYMGSSFNCYDIGGWDEM